MDKEDGDQHWKRSKTPNEAKPVNNISKNCRSFLKTSHIKKKVLPLHKLPNPGIYPSSFTNVHFCTMIEFSNVVECKWGSQVSYTTKSWWSLGGVAERWNPWKTSVSLHLEWKFNTNMVQNKFLWRFSLKTLFFF